jgi:hypothetical protein
MAAPGGAPEGSTPTGSTPEGSTGAPDRHAQRGADHAAGPDRAGPTGAGDCRSCRSPRLSALAAEQVPDVDSAMSAYLRYPGGATAWLNLSFTQGGKFQAAVHFAADHGQLRMQNFIHPHSRYRLTVRHGALVAAGASVAAASWRWIPLTWRIRTRGTCRILHDHGPRGLSERNATSACVGNSRRGLVSDGGRLSARRRCGALLPLPRSGWPRRACPGYSRRARSPSWGR